MRTEINWNELPKTALKVRDHLDHIINCYADVSMPEPESITLYPKQYLILDDQIRKKHKQDLSQCTYRGFRLTRGAES